jgi:hypothetical protein
MKTVANTHHVPRKVVLSPLKVALKSRVIMIDTRFVCRRQLIEGIQINQLQVGNSMTRVAVYSLLPSRQRQSGLRNPYLAGK